MITKNIIPTLLLISVLMGCNRKPEKCQPTIRDTTIVIGKKPTLAMWPRRDEDQREGMDTAGCVISEHWTRYVDTTKCNVMTNTGDININRVGTLNQ